MVAMIKVCGTTLKIRVKGRIPPCCECGQKGHIRANCFPPHVTAKEKDGEKVAGVALPIEVEAR